MRLHEARFAALARSGRFPYFAKMMQGIPASFDLDMDALFELGLARLLDGFTPLVEGRSRAHAASASLRQRPASRR